MGKGRKLELCLLTPLAAFTLVPRLGFGSLNWLLTHAQASLEPVTLTANGHMPPDRHGKP